MSVRNRLAWPGGSPVDTIIVAVLAVVSVIGVATELGGAPDPYSGRVGGFVLAVVAALPLLGRRRFPVSSTAAVVAAVAAYHLLGYPGLAPAICLFVAVYSAAAYARNRWGWLCGLGATVCAHVIPTLPPHRLPWYSYAVTGPVMGFVACLVIGIAARVRRLDGDARVQEAAATAKAQLNRRLAEERLTIARELHDVLAHSMSIIVVQSGVALDAIETDVDAAKDAMRAVREVAKRALPDLRGALALLRGGDESTVDLRSQPRLDDIADLVDRVRGTGLAITYTMDIGDADIAPLTELAAYRIVQEALTNVVRHANASTARVQVARDQEALLIDVSDDGRGLAKTVRSGTSGASGSAFDSRIGSGLGVVGMNERAGLVGGVVTVAEGRDHGVVVRARLPIEKGDS